MHINWCNALQNEPPTGLYPLGTRDRSIDMQAQGAKKMFRDNVRQAFPRLGLYEEICLAGFQMLLKGQKKRMARFQVPLKGQKNSR